MTKQILLDVPILRTEALTKSFGSFTANNNINISFNAGEIHAIIGENGAGKSTLMKMLYGVYKPTSGRIYIDGKETKMTPSAAMSEGIGMVFQDFRLIPAFTVLENVCMAIPHSGHNRAQIRNEIINVSEKYRIPIDPEMYVYRMDQGQRQRVEIVKTLMMPGSRMLIFDEPTSVLTYKEVEAFIDMLRSLRDDRYAVVLITHKLDEVMSCADTISVLRQGELIDCVKRSEGFERNRLIAGIMGSSDTQDIIHVKNSSVNDTGAKTVLSCENLNITDDKGKQVIHDINFNVKKGEILGVAGISGRGQKELLETLFGAKKSGGGKMIFDGSDISKENVKKRLDLGMVLISENPKEDNVVGDMTIAEHMPLGGIDIRDKRMGINTAGLEALVRNSSVAKELKVQEPDRVLSTLSGGNIQRVMLARAIMRSPKLLLAGYPSRGLDIGTVNKIHETLIKLKDNGCSVILVSEDLDELFALSDSIIVIADGKVYGKYDPAKTNAMEIGEIMVGGKTNDISDTVER